jgi:hypothetical protein
MSTARTSQEVKQSEGENTDPYDAEVINEWRYYLHFPIHLHVMHRDCYAFNFTCVYLFLLNKGYMCLCKHIQRHSINIETRSVLTKTVEN